MDYDRIIQFEMFDRNDKKYDWYILCRLSNYDHNIQLPSKFVSSLSLALFRNTLDTHCLVFCWLIFATIVGKLLSWYLGYYKLLRSDEHPHP